MSDDSTPAPDKPAEPTDPKQQSQGDPGDKPLGESGEKALKAERDRASAAEKQAKDLQVQLDRINQANESALEKAQRETKEAQELALTAGTEALRFRIAAETGITDNVDLILTAPDEETMRKQADLWGKRQPAQDTTSKPGPRPDLSQGGSGEPPALNSNALEDALKAKLGI